MRLRHLTPQRSYFKSRACTFLVYSLFNLYLSHRKNGNVKYISMKTQTNDNVTTIRIQFVGMHSHFCYTNYIGPIGLQWNDERTFDQQLFSFRIVKVTFMWLTVDTLVIWTCTHIQIGLLSITEKLWQHNRCQVWGISVTDNFFPSALLKWRVRGCYFNIFFAKNLTQLVWKKEILTETSDAQCMFEMKYYPL